MVAAILYEHIVEEIELLDGRPFTISSMWIRAMNRPVERVCGIEVTQPAWRRWGDGPSLYVIARNVVQDLAAHGLVRCMRQDRPRRRCLEWRAMRPE